MHIHHDMVNGGHTHDHSHEHSHTHEHTHDGVTHTHEHSHTHGHDHAHPHEHDHLHGEGHAHDHDHGCACGCDHEHTHSHECGSCGCGCGSHTPIEELMALMNYMVNHNAAHAKELADLAVQLEKLGNRVAYEQVMAAVSDFEKGNLRLGVVLASLEVK